MAAATQAVFQEVVHERNKEKFLNDSHEPFPVGDLDVPDEDLG
jgi:hypothetical protein